MIKIDGHTVNPRDLFARATNGNAYAPYAWEMHKETDLSTKACRVYATLIGERKIDPWRHREQIPVRKPVVRTVRKGVRLDLQEWREARERLDLQDLRESRE